MSAGAIAATGAAAAGAAAIRAIQASGAIVRVEPDDFLKLLHLMEEPLVVHAAGGFLRPQHSYLTSFRGLAFATRCPFPLKLPPGRIAIEAQRIWIPG